MHAASLFLGLLTGMLAGPLVTTPLAAEGSWVYVH
jgi:hypothetical protein